MRAEIKLTDVKDIRDLHEYINAELRCTDVGSFAGGTGNAENGSGN